jgi:hypothetical protein
MISASYIQLLICIKILVIQIKWFGFNPSKPNGTVGPGSYNRWVFGSTVI